MVKYEYFVYLQGQESWPVEKPFKFYCKHFHSRTEVAYFCMNNRYRTRTSGSWDKEQPTSTADNEIPYEPFKINSLNPNLNSQFVNYA